MSVFIGRIAAAIASAVITWVIALLGLPVTEAQQVGAIEWLTEGLTGLGVFLGLLLYGVIHKMINAKLNPVDAARPAEAEEIRAHTYVR